MSYDNKNNLTKEILTALVPKMALIAYQSNRDSSSYYLEARKINQQGEMGAGMPVSVKFLRDIAENFVDSESEIPFGIVPENMLYCDTRRGFEQYVWYNPPQKRAMYFRESLKVDSAEYYVPGVIYHVQNSSLHIYAYKDKTISSMTKLYVGPFFNTTDGSVCLGSTTLKMPQNITFKKLLEYWEARFWKTEFTHLGGSANPTKENLVMVTKRAREQPFDLTQLISAGKTLKDMIK